MSDTTATCTAQEWQRDGRGLWAMRACRLEPEHGNRHEFSPWRYSVDVREAIAVLAPPAEICGWCDQPVEPGGAFKRTHWPSCPKPPADRAAEAPAPEGLRLLAEQLYEEIGGGLCICQRADVPHWCESCQGRIDKILAALRARPALSDDTLREAFKVGMYEATDHPLEDQWVEAAWQRFLTGKR